MKIIDKPIPIVKVKKMAKAMFGDFVKAVVDIDKKTMAIDAELHSDQEALLLSKGSKQQNLWGINLYPEETDDNFIEFNSVINIRPSVDNLSTTIGDQKIKDQITKIVNTLVKK